MKISKIDKNFKDSEACPDIGKTYTLPCFPFTIHGGFYDKTDGFISMPTEVAANISEKVVWGSHCSSGIRLTFSTNSTKLTLKVENPLPIFMKNMAFSSNSGFSLEEKVGGRHKFVGMVTPPVEQDESDRVDLLRNYSMTFNLEGGKMRNYILYFPLYSAVKRLEITVDEEAEIKEFFGYKKDVLPIMYYGSSITQGASASRSDSTYQCMVSEKLNMDFINHGFSGNAFAETEMAEYLANNACSAFVCDYDHNAPSVEYLKNTHERLFKIFRAKQKDTPVIFLTKPDKHEKNGIDEERNARAEVIRATYENALKNGDKNVYFIDCRDVFPKDAVEYVTIDGVHPNDLGMYYMAKALIKVLKDIKLRKY